LKTYWSIPERQVETSVVLVEGKGDLQHSGEAAQAMKSDKTVAKSPITLVRDEGDGTPRTDEMSSFLRETGGSLKACL